MSRIDNPVNTKCGHNFEWWDCPYRYCLMRHYALQYQQEHSLSLEEMKSDVLDVLEFSQKLDGL